MRIPFIRNEVHGQDGRGAFSCDGFGAGLVVGCRCARLAAGLARFFLWGGVTLPAVETIKQARWARRLRMLDDARMEQEGMMRAYRDTFGDS